MRALSSHRRIKVHFLATSIDGFIGSIRWCFFKMLTAFNYIIYPVADPETSKRRVKKHKIYTTAWVIIILFYLLLPAGGDP